MPVIDVVTASLFQTTAQIRSLDLESRVVPVFLERKLFGDIHRVDDPASQTVVRRSCSYNPIANIGSSAYLALAGGQRTEAVERIRCETEVESDNVGKEFHKQFARSASGSTDLLHWKFAAAREMRSIVRSVDRVDDVFRIPADHCVAVFD